MSKQGWKNWAKRKTDTWTWTTVWWLLGGEGIQGLNDNGKYNIDLKNDKK